LAAFSAIGHRLSSVASQLADVSTLAPLVYIELIGAMLIGYFVFRDVPDAATLTGAGLIIAADLVLIETRSRSAASDRERARPRPAAPQPRRM